MIRRAFPLVVFAIACSDDDPGTRYCIGDESDSRDCTITWALNDVCSQVAGAATVEMALFADQCPENAALLTGDTSAAVFRSTFAPGTPFSPIEDLPIKEYGFGFIARDASCKVVAFGCTQAHLAVITTIRTAVCDWTSKDSTGAPMCACAPLAGGGGCPSAETCADGTCG